METQGIKYTGSKREIFPALLGLIRPLDIKTVLDGFSGTTRVSQALKQTGYTVYANDVADWSKVFGQCYLLNKKSAGYYLPLINHLNNLSGKYGWFSENYGGEPNGGSATQEDGRKRIWQLHNTQKLDAIREEIDKIAKDEIEGTLSERSCPRTEKAVRVQKRSASAQAREGRAQHGHWRGHRERQSHRGRR